MPVRLPCLVILLCAGVALCGVSHNADTASTREVVVVTYIFVRPVFVLGGDTCLVSLSGSSPSYDRVLCVVSHDADTASTWSQTHFCVLIFSEKRCLWGFLCLAVFLILAWRYVLCHTTLTQLVVHGHHPRFFSS